MEREKSCGAVVFSRNEQGEIRYVIVQQRSGRHCFPKGHVEPNETEQQTALREIWEETGLRPVILDGFREHECYEITKKPGVWKDVYYFIAEYQDGPVPGPTDNEIHEAKAYPFEEALALLETESRKNILIKANAYLAGFKGRLLEEELSPA